MQDELLRFIERHIALHELSPTFTEMTAGLGLKSTSQVARIVDALEERKRIRRPTGKKRGIQVLRPASTTALVLPVDHHGRIDVTLSDRVTPDWLARHRAGVDRAIAERFAAVAAHGPAADLGRSS